jgi:hypothetical protein
MINEWGSIIVVWKRFVQIHIINIDPNITLFFSDQNDVRNPFGQGNLIDELSME